MRNKDKLEEYDIKNLNRLKRYQLSGQFKELVNNRSRMEEQTSFERIASKLSFDRFKVEAARGYDIVT